MTQPFRTPNFRGWRALVLHKPGPVTEALLRQFGQLGMEGGLVWPQIAPGTAADVLFFDVDLGHDGQFPWPPGQAPMPLIALLGSEAPGRVEWALTQRPQAHLLKPLGSAGVYGALVIASHAYATQCHLEQEVAALKSRLSRRPAVVEAVVALMQRDGIDTSAAAYARLRRLAMSSQRSIEDAAEDLLRPAGRRRA
jgi:AmiR/NasT family two-component response regulator